MLPTADQRTVLHTFLARHGTRYPELMRTLASAQVHVEFLERSPTGIMSEAIARERASADLLTRGKVEVVGSSVAEVPSHGAARRAGFRRGQTPA